MHFLCNAKLVGHIWWEIFLNEKFILFSGISNLCSYLCYKETTYQNHKWSKRDHSTVKVCHFSLAAIVMTYIPTPCSISKQSLVQENAHPILIVCYLVNILYWDIEFCIPLYQDDTSRSIWFREDNFLKSIGRKTGFFFEGRLLLLKGPNDLKEGGEFGAKNFTQKP